MNHPHSPTIFDKKWKPEKYLEQYYQTKSIAEDELHIFNYMLSFLKSTNTKFDKVLEFGCGPTIHHTIPLATYANEIHMSDYMTSNLTAVRQWLDSSSKAFNWDVYIKGILKLELRRDPSMADVDLRKKALRSKITQLTKGDLHLQKPLGKNIEYPLVTSFYCADSATNSTQQWREFMKHLSSLVQPGGWLLFSALRNTTHYQVLDHKFPSANISTKEIHNTLTQLNYKFIDTIKVKILEWEEEGFDSIIIAKAMKANNA